MQITNIASFASVLSVSPDIRPEQTVRGITDDSRKVQPGSLFVVKQGFHDDGMRFVTDARAKGAIAIVANQPIEHVPLIHVTSVHEFEKQFLSLHYDGVETKMYFAGITGTKGKTTSAFLIYEYLQRRGEPVCYIGTIGIYDKNRRSVRNMYTTPDVYSLYAILDEKYREGHTICIMEVSSHALAQHRINGIRYTVAGFTNLSHDHLDYHHTMEEYYSVKKTLFTDHLNGYAVINCHDTYGKRLFSELMSEKKIGFGEKSVHEYTLHERIDHSCIDCGDFTVITGMPGTYNAENAVLAGYMLRAMGYSETRYQFGLLGIPGRLEKVTARGITVYVDYAHSPDSLEKVLELLQQRKTARLITVFGCTGDRDRTKRPVMAQIAEHYSDYVVITSDDPHSEDPETICCEVESGMSGTQYVVEPDRKKAIALALNYAQEGDIVLIAGKGHETVQIFDGFEIPFNDREVVEEFFRLQS